MKKILFSLLAAVVLTACTSEKDDTKIFSNFATLDAITSNGAALTVQNPGDSKVLSLTASQAINADGFKAGSRVFIQYSTPTNTNTESGACTLQAMFNTEGGGAEIMANSADATNNWESNEIQLSEVTVTGNYLNIIGVVEYNSKYTCNLYVDSATLNDAYPSLYLVYNLEGMGEQYLTFLGSWSFEQLRMSGNCKGFNLYANNPNYSGAIKIELQ